MNMANLWAKAFLFCQRVVPLALGIGTTLFFTNLLNTAKIEAATYTVLIAISYGVCVAIYAFPRLAEMAVGVQGFSLKLQKIEDRQQEILDLQKQLRQAGVLLAEIALTANDSAGRLVAGSEEVIARAEHVESLATRLLNAVEASPIERAQVFGIHNAIRAYDLAPQDEKTMYGKLVEQARAKRFDEERGKESLRANDLGTSKPN